jgi:carbon monoxide dehydrogenase subunit G
MDRMKVTTIRITPEIRAGIELRRLGDEKLAQTTRRLLREILKEKEVD